MQYELIFIYNAQSGKLNALFDIGHKVLRPQTYACGLCALTHGAFRESAAWKQFREHSSVPLSFYHKDEMEKLDVKVETLPVILLRAGDQQDIFLSADEIAEQRNVEQLIKTITEKIAELNKD